MNATGQALKHFGFDEAEPDLITGGGQPMIQFMGSIGFDNAGPQNLMNDSVTSGGVTMDVDDDLGFFPFVIAGAAFAKLFAGGAAAATALKVKAAAAIAGAKAVTAGQVGATAVTGAVSGAASFGMSKALGADMDNDYGQQPWMPEVAVDVLA